MSPHIKTLVVKIASRCNLNCSYCYMYNKGDNSYLSQPKFMSKETADSMARAVVKHMKRHGLRNFDIVFHGGEPLLAGQDRIQELIDCFSHQTKETDLEIQYSIQTNGLLITKDWCNFFIQNNISIGISIDGEKDMNDKFRVDHQGKGSYEGIIKAIEISNKYLPKGAGLLTVINPETSPERLIKHFAGLGGKRIDFLFPDNNYSNLPQRPTMGKYSSSSLPYGEWLFDLYEIWEKMPDPERPKIRIFQNIILKFYGFSIASDILGNDVNQVLVIETNGDIEPIDSMKICGEGFTKTNINIKTSDLDDAFKAPLASLYYSSSKFLAEQCKSCPILEFCGGGHIVHRYNANNGFMNPTIYCKDYILLITNIQSKLVKELSEELSSQFKIVPISNESVLESLNIETKSYY